MQKSNFKKRKKSNKIKSFPVEYKGFTVPTGNFKIERVEASIDPKEFFDKYIAKRKPVIISGHIQDSNWLGNLWRDPVCPSINKVQQTDEYLKQRAGECRVKVEASGTKGLFGTGLPKKVMKFGDLVDKLASGCDNLYMTTQYEDENPSKHDNTEDEDHEEELWKKMVADACPPPLPCLKGDFPAVPCIFGNLVPQQVNLWMGNSPDGSSSGLHHDFHDNLYVLLRGKKRFTLFSPRDAPYMYLHGNVERVHPNGLINYLHRGTRADGATMAAVARHKVKQAEDNLARAQAAQVGIEEAEALLDAAMDEILGACDDGEAIDDFEDLDEFSDEDVAPKKKQRKVQEDSKEDDPPSFSRVDVSTLHAYIANRKGVAKFPLLSKATPLVCELTAGEMLYLPASWFHEVSSFSHKNGGHMAFNYWMHPPSTLDYESPYEDNYWREVWTTIQDMLAQNSKGVQPNSDG